MMVVWLAAALLHFTPQPATDSRRIEVEGVAREMLAESFAAAENPLFPGKQARSRTALLEASIASFESQIRWDVQQGHCRAHECDHGRASCWNQIQPGPTGLLLTDDGMWGYAKRGQEGAITAAELIDPMMCIEAGIHFARASLVDVGTLGEYTGEGKDGPLARHRWDAARAWWRAHPPPFDDDQLVSGIN